MLKEISFILQTLIESDDISQQLSKIENLICDIQSRLPDTEQTNHETYLDIFATILLKSQTCFSLDDLCRLMEHWTILDTESKNEYYSRQIMDSDKAKIIKQLQEELKEQVEELLALYDPEKTNLVGMNDYFLLLKDLFIQKHELIFHLGSKQNLFDQQNSLRSFTQKIDYLLFEVVGLSRPMYKSASKNVQFPKQIFWPILEALLDLEQVFIHPQDLEEVSSEITAG